MSSIQPIITYSNLDYLLRLGISCQFIVNQQINSILFSTLSITTCFQKLNDTVSYISHLFFLFVIQSLFLNYALLIAFFQTLRNANYQQVHLLYIIWNMTITVEGFLYGFVFISLLLPFTVRAHENLHCRIIINSKHLITFGICNIHLSYPSQTLTF